MKIVVAKDGEKLCQIVYRHYGRLDLFGDILAANKELHNKVILSDGDRVLLPKIEKKPVIKEALTLW